jgi:hypothetical protein
VHDVQNWHATTRRSVRSRWPAFPSDLGQLTGHAASAHAHDDLDLQHPATTGGVDLAPVGLWFCASVFVLVLCIDLALRSKQAHARAHDHQNSAYHQEEIRACAFAYIHPV